MATSSIFRNVVLKSEEDVTNFVDAIERSQQDTVPKISVDVEYIEQKHGAQSPTSKVVGQASQRKNDAQSDKVCDTTE